MGTCTDLVCTRMRQCGCADTHQVASRKGGLAASGQVAANELARAAGHSLLEVPFEVVLVAPVLGA